MTLNHSSELMKLVVEQLAQEKAMKVAPIRLADRRRAVADRRQSSRLRGADRRRAA